MKVIKKDLTKQDFDPIKIVFAITKSADRVGAKLSNEEVNKVVDLVWDKICVLDEVSVYNLHGVVESCLSEVSPQAGKSYREYRNYKIQSESQLMSEITDGIEEILDGADDRSNSNSDSKLIPNQRIAISGKLMKELYKKYHLSIEENQAIEDGAIYIHDLTMRLLKTFNCCLYNVEYLLENGFELAGQRYVKPKRIMTAVGIVSDIIFSASGFQYGGFTIPHIDKVLAPYLKMNIEYETKKNIKRGMSEGDSKKFALEDSYDIMKQMLQGLEMKLNTLNSCRGDFTFCTFTFGDVSNEYEAMVSRAILEVRHEGHGEIGFKQTQIFPKLVFIYNEEKHGDNKEYEWLFNNSIKVSSKCQYPDTIPNTKVSPMGCRSFLSEYIDPQTNEAVYTGRGNIGVVSLNLPWIYQYSKVNNKNFYEVLDYYLEMIRTIHQKTYAHIGRARASSNPLGFTQGGFHKGFLEPNDRVYDVIKDTFTSSFGITALNELTQLHMNKSIAEDSSFAQDVMDYINDKINYFKKEDGYLYGIYGTPAESLCQTQVKQFVKSFGVIENVSDREYFSNSFHAHVTEDITPFEKQDIEEPMFHKATGGHIAYCRIENPKNLKALKAIVKRGINKGFYQGVNFATCACYDCGHQDNDFNGQCPNCGSENYSEYARITGYMGTTRSRRGATINDAKLQEIKDRKSM